MEQRVTPLELFFDLATTLPALLSLAFVALVACALIAFETVAYADYRDSVRHGT
jgi:hypothetical protein